MSREGPAGAAIAKLQEGEAAPDQPRPRALDQAGRGTSPTRTSPAKGGRGAGQPWIR